MTLTEEQRAAIHAVSGLLTAIGCPQCHSYLQKNYTHHIEVLRAMTDSSEQFSDATKMIGFDMEKARASIAHYRIENPSNVDTESALKELVDQANLAEDALAEIERLQLELTQAMKDISTKDGIIEKLKKEFLMNAYKHNKASHGHAWYPGDETYREYLDRVDAAARKTAQESLKVVLIGDQL